MTYRPGSCYQLDGTPYASENCVACTGVLLIDRYTVGRIRTTAAEIRKRSGVQVHKGIEYRVLEAVAAGFGVTLERRGFDNPATRRGQLMNLVASGRGVGLIIDTHVTAGTPFRTGGPNYTFKGIHSIFLSEYAFRQVEKPHAVFVVEDPGTKAGYLEWPADLVYRAAEAGGNGAIYTIATLDTEGVLRKGRIKANQRSAPNLTSKDVGNIVVGRDYRVLSTRNGGPWTRDNGTQANGWHMLGPGRFTKGESLR